MMHTDTVEFCGSQARVLKSWSQREQAHHERAARFTNDHIARRKAGVKHPVFDFLFEYYPIRAAHVSRWYPGVGVVLADAGTSIQAGWKFYRTQDGLTGVDVDRVRSQRLTTLTYIRDLLSKTVSNPAHFDCFGLHEWAMVYKASSVRHDLPLRLSSAETDAVVEQHSIRCTHFDAFRFFTPAAHSLNLHVLDRESQPDFEQQGCLHAGMDLYKWAAKLGPLVPGELWLDAFEVAWDARILDMEASPYDCRGFGLSVVAIETSAGKQEYVRRQREIAARAMVVRQGLLAVLDSVL
ncbi:3-methyladenine DNA glycosylase [Corynebacterium felinum]|uniref:3-methyladenine DNA glycosylase n=1 Tax=Corynebacterium felinum TaxID=131318 RepID=A0ABU2BAG3_9CORY|nr:3-methyladenine DNA glycosylase [Corynebacterium felinum]MDF5819683.1 3-methyladenine DNA glycosylase [Corynebacterium felinum]MDR7355600.1 hypothetical protein [Corynebacterium felinum]WJY94950.1 hypothetical protein CFELI_06670 [Corynebacterium felinum]